MNSKSPVKILAQQEFVLTRWVLLVYLSEVLGEHLTGLESSLRDRISLSFVFLERLQDLFVVGQSESSEPVGERNSVVDSVDGTRSTGRIHLENKNVSTFWPSIETVQQTVL